ncbi:hypothetical protein ABB37_08930 [Leptomonas pyrrhocoris]|uniref:Uncharacterized protein n=1 Tax=Leptomonas pyrrhocoris TaxID=157538 RepID=A0A0N0DRQ0_LEPPY|nr:hypothetical protein ABB37_08930 [Leptomonas pyrrhocoris]KPA74962.1 hypothetical protein ABB37_08930 [Leptomonas pyrrhocoris]|eukprot:XP_015653401.1 hypothetical protein ABB37_08930 [Leptomonas pyrrhocoris]
MSRWSELSFGSGCGFQNRISPLPLPLLSMAMSRWWQPRVSAVLFLPCACWRTARRPQASHHHQVIQRFPLPSARPAVWDAAQQRRGVHVGGSATVLRGRRYAACRKGMYLTAAPSVFLYTTQAHSQKEDDEDGVRVTVTSTTLFAELRRLFPWSAPYNAWRQNRTSQPSSTATTSGTESETHRSVLSSVHTGGYDWRRLFLVRCTPPSPENCRGAAPALSSLRAASGAAQRTRDSATAEARYGTRTYDSECLSRRTPQFDLTDEGRAVLLWRRCAAPMTPCSDDAGEGGGWGTSGVFCWPEPATYVLYYAPFTPAAAANSCEVPGSCGRAPRGSSGGKRKPRKRISSAVKGDGDDEAVGVGLCGAERAEVQREELYCVGRIHAIPGLPQLPPITLTSSPLIPSTGLTTPSAEPQNNRHCSNGTTGAVTPVVDPAVHEAAGSPCLTGAVCSLHDYQARLCGAVCDAPVEDRSGGGGAGVSDEASASTAATRTPTPATPQTEGTDPLRESPVTRASRSTRTAHARTSTPTSSRVLASSTLGVQPPASSRFPFPVFFHSEATPRSNGAHCTGDRWSKEPPTQSRSSSTRLADPVTSTAHPRSRRGRRSSSPPRPSAPIADTAAIPQPSVPHMIPAHSPCHRHWNCVPSSDFLREFLLFHPRKERRAATAAAPRSAEVDGGDGQARPPSFAKATRFYSEKAPALSAETRVLRDDGVGVLLVHEHEWIFFSLLLHTCSAAAAAAGSGLVTAAFHPLTCDRDRSNEASERAAAARPDDAARSENLSHYYCFLNPPCRLSTDELERIVRAGPTAALSCAAARPVTPPRTWLVHLSTEVTLQRTVERLWAASDLRVSVAAGETPTREFATRHSHSACDAAGVMATLDDEDRGGCLVAVVPPRCTGASRDNAAPGDRVEDDGADDSEEGEWAAETDEAEVSDGQLRQRTCVSTALQKKALRRACEVELLSRYLRRTAATSLPRNTCPPHPHQRECYTPTSSLSTTDSKETHSTCATPPDVAPRPSPTMIVSPFPPSTALLRNRSWFSKPFVLAEEVKYGVVIKYKQAALAVPRACGPLRDL